METDDRNPRPLPRRWKQGLTEPAHEQASSLLDPAVEHAARSTRFRRLCERTRDPPCDGYGAGREKWIVASRGTPARANSLWRLSAGPWRLRGAPWPALA